jgi:hypothetical protein
MNIDMDKKCRICKKPGALDNGLCLECINKRISRGDYDHIIKKEKRIFPSMSAIGRPGEGD